MNYKVRKDFFNFLELEGVQPRHWLQISPLYGKKEYKQILKARIDFFSQSHPRVKKADCAIELPGFSRERFHYSLQLHYFDDEHRLARYWLETHEGAPFLINGAYSFASFLRLGDQLQLGVNYLKCCAQRGSPMKSEVFIDSRLAKSQLTILIQGETGTGKTRLAREIHQRSGRSGNFVHINLSSFSSSLIESELFGHCRGAFTGALAKKVGALESANHGTLFLDEIDSLPLDLQVKLLLFLDDFKFRAVGDLNTKKIETRLIVASGQDLEALVAKNLMRKDFYYRIASGRTLYLPALREKTDLVRQFCYEYAEERKIHFAPALIAWYQQLPWPGNFRQLKQHLELKYYFSSSSRIDFDEIDIELESKIKNHKIEMSYCQKLSEFKGNVKLCAHRIKERKKILTDLVGQNVF